MESLLVICRRKHSTSTTQRTTNLLFKNLAHARLPQRLVSLFSAKGGTHRRSPPPTDTTSFFHQNSIPWFPIETKSPVSTKCILLTSTMEPSQLLDCPLSGCNYSYRSEKTLTNHLTHYHGLTENMASGLMQQKVHPPVAQVILKPPPVSKSGPLLSQPRLVSSRNPSSNSGDPSCSGGPAPPTKRRVSARISTLAVKRAKLSEQQSHAACPIENDDISALPQDEFQHLDDTDTSSQNFAHNPSSCPFIRKPTGAVGSRYLSVPPSLPPPPSSLNSVPTNETGTYQQSAVMDGIRALASLLASSDDEGDCPSDDEGDCPSDQPVPTTPASQNDIPPSLGHHVVRSIVSPFDDPASLSLLRGQRLAVRLLELFNFAGVPLYLYDETVCILKEESLRGLNPKEHTIPTRDKILTDLSKCFKIPLPSAVPVTLEPPPNMKAGPREKVNVIAYNFIESSNDFWMDRHLRGNLENFCGCVDPEDPFKMVPLPEDGSVDEIVTSNFARRTRAQIDRILEEERKQGFKESRPIFFDIIIIYTDSTGTDQYQRCPVEPVMYTSALFNRKCRFRSKYWKPLGYIPSLKAKSSAAQKKGAGTLRGQGRSCRNYHKCMSVLMDSFIAGQGYEHRRYATWSKHFSKILYHSF